MILGGSFYYDRSHGGSGSLAYAVSTVPNKPNGATEARAAITKIINTIFFSVFKSKSPPLT